MNEEHLKLILPDIFEELNIIADDRRINELANMLSLLSDETFSPNPKDINYEQKEIDQLKKDLDKCKSAIWCLRCNGSGSIMEILAGGQFAPTTCYACDGEGRI